MNQQEVSHNGSKATQKCAMRTQHPSLNRNNIKHFYTQSWNNKEACFQISDTILN